MASRGRTRPPCIMYEMEAGRGAGPERKSKKMGDRLIEVPFGATYEDLVGDYNFGAWSDYVESSASVSISGCKSVICTWAELTSDFMDGYSSRIYMQFDIKLDGEWITILDNNFYDTDYSVYTGIYNCLETNIFDIEGKNEYQGIRSRVCYQTSDPETPTTVWCGGTLYLAFSVVPTTDVIEIGGQAP